MSPRVRTLSSLLSVIGVIVGVPVVLVGVSRARFGSGWPFAGWRWLAPESAPGAWLAESLVRAALLASWAVVVWVLVGLLAEVVFQFRHGMPSTPRHDWVGSRLVRRAAAGLLAVVPVQQMVPPLHAVAQPVEVRVEVVPAMTVATTSVAGDVEVVPGDSVWSIAADHAAGREVAAVAADIIRLNLGRVMTDGETFTTPALIHPGWRLVLPTPWSELQTDVVVGHVVGAGESYWSIAEDVLPGASGAELAAAARQLVRLNADRLAHGDPTMLHPGDVVMLEAPPVVDRQPAAPEVRPTAPDMEPRVTAVADDVEPPADVVAPAPAETSGTEPATSRAAGLAILAVGLMGVVAARRLSALRASRPGLRPVLPGPNEVAMERSLRRVAENEVVARVDLVLRVLASVPELPAATAVVAGEDGAVRVWCEAVATEPPVGGLVDGVIVVPAALPTEELIDRLAGDPAWSPSPALVHLGRSAEGAVFVDLERLGTFSLDMPRLDAVGAATHLAASLASSPFASSVVVRTVGLDAPLLDELGVERSAADDAVGDLVRHSDAVVAALAGRPVRDARSSVAGDACEPFVVVSVDELGTPPPLPATCVVAPRADGPWRLSGGRSGAVLHPLGIELVPAIVDAPMAIQLADLVAVADDLALAEATDPVDAMPPDAEHDFLVRTFGQVEVVDAAGRPVRFEKQKSLELVVWMSLHRRRSTRSAARDALWSVAVRDATFANVVSDARRSMARAVEPPEGEEWIARTLTDELALHPGVSCDIDLVAALTDRARRLPAGEAIEVLRRALGLVAGLPFAGTSFSWTDAEGITSSGVLAATTAACELADRCLQVGDVEGVFWATGQGLQVLPGHEELIAYRMRAHAASGDRAGVRAEWESYERAVLADPWSDGSVAPKLVSLRTELLAPLGSAR